jgi:hypothetical protein
MSRSQEGRTKLGIGRETTTVLKGSQTVVAITCCADSARKHTNIEEDRREKSKRILRNHYYD